MKYNYYNTLANYANKHTSLQTISAVSEAVDYLPDINPYNKTPTEKLEAFEVVTALYARKGEIQKLNIHLEKVDHFFQRHDATPGVYLKNLAKTAFSLLPKQYKPFISKKEKELYCPLENSVYHFSLKLLELNLIDESIELGNGFSPMHLHAFNRSLCRKYINTHQLEKAMSVANNLPRRHSPQNYFFEICERECNFSKLNELNMPLIKMAINSIKKFVPLNDADNKIYQLVINLVHLAKLRSANELSVLISNVDVKNRAKRYISKSIYARIRRAAEPLHQLTNNPPTPVNYTPNANGNYTVNNLNRSVQVVRQPTQINFPPNLNGNYTVNNLNYNPSAPGYPQNFNGNPTRMN